MPGCGTAPVLLYPRFQTSPLCHPDRPSVLGRQLKEKVHVCLSSSWRALQQEPGACSSSALAAEAPDRGQCRAACCEVTALPYPPLLAHRSPRATTQPTGRWPPEPGQQPAVGAAALPVTSPAASSHSSQYSCITTRISFGEHQSAKALKSAQLHCTPQFSNW